MTEKVRHVSMISGRGSTLEAIVRACRNGEIQYMETVGVIASNLFAYQTAIAKDLGIPVMLIDPKEDKLNFGNRIVHALQDWGVDVVTQNGWLPLTPQNVIERYNHLYNQHPGPWEFGGKGMFGARVTAARLAYLDMVGRDWWTEAMVQRVGVRFDEGEVLKLGRVEILPNDTVETLQSRLLIMEHQIQIRFLQDVVVGRVTSVPKRESLVRSGEEHILEDAKRIGMSLYPHG